MEHVIPRPSRSVVLASGVTVAAVAAAVLGSAPAGAVTATHFAYGGQAYGSYVKLGSLVDVGRTAYTPMCTTKAGTSRVNKTAKVDLGLAGSIGAVTSGVHATHSGSTSTSTATSAVASTTLLGAIHLDAVTTKASVSHSGTTYRMGGTSTFLGLTVAGKALPAHPAANSTYAIPGVGSLTVNEQSLVKRHGIPTATVTALDIRIGSSNSLGLTAGRVIIGRSVATLKQARRLASGSAFATALSVASVVGSGPTAAAYTGCGGTLKKGHSNNLTGISLPNGIATVAVAKSSVRTADTAARTTSVSRNTVAGVSLLNGMITAKVIATQANAARNAAGRYTLSRTGTTLLGLVVAGKAVPVPPVGESRSIPGLGSLTFGYTHKSATGIQVYGIRLVLGSARDGLPAGAVVTVGAANAAVAR